MKPNMTDTGLGELEQAVLLGILAQGSEAFALEVRNGMEEEAGKKVSRGAFYTTLERLERKGMVEWELSQPAKARRKGAQRRFSVTASGLQALRSTQAQLHARWTRLTQALEEL
jgi:DNA-binding PadR family transcriptional regulator